VTNHTAKDFSITYRQELIDVLGRHGVGTSPDLARLDSLQVEPGDDAEVTAPALQGPEQIRMALLVSFHNRAISKNDLVVDNGITAEANLVSVEVDTASEEQSRHADRAKTATSSGQVELLQVFVDIAPSKQR
jgi:hypothetical protein